ncbi:leucine-rich repeat flightless-interacting protein 1 isoform X19 [Falco rusticolus]|uniref:leucine-rich repeat flightless-interacting protein 1 isoform X19 n=1 Tax=Falco rusticolus TaxID=120794 RepID=UPI0018866072|nr:leucine-rich repeat flightless-interacting protein 1 isoform X19 [Falco rusticolus]
MEAAADCLSPAARQQAEARLAAKRAARAEAREIRMKELERQQKEEDSERYSRRARRNASASDEDERMSVGSRGSLRIEERPEKDFEKGARTVSSLSAATLASLGGTSSRRGSGDTSISADTEASIREIKDSLAEVEEKYKKAMVSNAQLDNEKTNFMYQVDTLKDALLELEEQLAESRRQYEEKSKEFEREKHAHSILQFQFTEIKEALKQREEMLAKHGIIPDSDIATNGETSDIPDNEGHLDSSKTVPGTTEALKAGGDGTLGKANEVDMKNEILEDVGKREILQNTEHEEHREESEEQEVQTLHADENAKAEKMVEECDALSTVMLSDSRCTEQIVSLTERVSGSTSSNGDSDADDLRKVTESAGTAVQQPVSMEAEHCDLNARINQNSDLGALQVHRIFETPQEMHGDFSTEHELEYAAPNQEEQEDLKTRCALSDNEMDQEADITSESCELVSDQAGLLEITLAGMLSKEVNVESHTEELQHSEESAENKVTNVSEEKLAESKGCTDARTDETAGYRAEEENEVGNAAQIQTRETESVGLEETRRCESGVPADTIEKEGGGYQAHIQPVFSEDSSSASSEEQNMQNKTELENATAKMDRQKAVLVKELEMCSDSAGTGRQDKASVEAVGCITEGKESVLQQAEPDTDVVKEAMAQETSLDPSLLDDKIKKSELETGDESGKEKGSRREWVEDLKPEVEVQTVQCNEETMGDTVGEKNTPLDHEVQNVVKQEEGESKEESAVVVSVTAENKVDKETLEENEQDLKLAGHHGGGFVSEEGADNSLAQKAEQDENVSEKVELEGQAEEGLEDDGDAFDFDEESKQILETGEKCDGEKADTQKEEGGGANGAVGKIAQTGEAGEGTNKIETEDDSLQHKEGDELEETGLLQGESSWKTDEKTDVMEDEIKSSNSTKVGKIPDEKVLEQDLESADNNKDESKEDLQGGRRGKGKSRDDCTIS